MHIALPLLCDLSNGLVLLIPETGEFGKAMGVLTIKCRKIRAHLITFRSFLSGFPGVHGNKTIIVIIDHRSDPSGISLNNYEITMNK
jgi:hypothetical protein